MASMVQYSTDLSPMHAELLREGSNISDDIINARGYASVSWDKSDKDGRKFLRSLDIPYRALPADGGSGMLIPMYDTKGQVATYQFRPDSAVEDGTGKVTKYFSPGGQSCRVDIHPFNLERLQDPSIPLIITEGVKKADAMTSAGQCVVALSGIWNWRNKLGTLGDWEDVPLKNRNIVICFDSDARENQSILHSMQRLRNWLLSKGARSVKYLLVPQAYGELSTKGADDYLAAGGSIESMLSQAVDTLNDYIVQSAKFSDSMLSYRVADDVMDGRFAWTPGCGWLEYQDGVWVEVEDVRPLEAIRIYAASHYGIALAEFKSGVVSDKTEVTGWESLLRRRKMTDILALCRGIDGVYANDEDFDSDPDKLNVRNGYLDLITGDLIPHDPSQKCMKMAGVDYIPGYTHVLWDKALEAIPEDILDWAQLRYGQAITGRAPGDDRMIIEFGRGGNGKSTIVDGISGALGNYYRLISNKILMAGDSDSMPTEGMDLKGLRFAQLEETPESRRLDVNKMKQSVGTSEITARPLYRKSVTFPVTHSMFISTNNIPVVNETDDGSWRRLVLMKYPFSFKMTEDEIKTDFQKLGIEGLKEDVKQNKDIHRACLAWLVAGALRWYESGKKMGPLPERVKADTEAWRGESDAVLAFFNDRMIPDPDAVIPTQDLFDALNDWLRDSNKREWGIETMNNKFSNHGKLLDLHIAKAKMYSTKVTNRYLNQSKESLGPRISVYTGMRFRLRSDTERAENDPRELSAVV